MQYTLNYRNVQNSSVLRFEHADIVDINHLIYIHTLLGHSVNNSNEHLLSELMFVGVNASW